MLSKNVHDKGYSRNKSFVLNFIAFYYVGLERSWWSLFQKHVVCITLYSILLCCLRTFMIKVIPEIRRLY